MSEGKKHDQDKIRFDLIPVESIEALAKVLKMGAEKYGDNNWREGIKYHRVYRAAQHHLQEFWGEHPDKDDESGLPHLYHALCNIAFLITYEDNKERYRTFDDRAGSNNKYYEEQEEKIFKLANLVHNNKDFFAGELTDDCLETVYNTLNYAIHSPYTTIKEEESAFPDLTKMTHPEACEHLEVGMRVKVLCSCVINREDWKAGWMEEMDEFVGTEAVISEINVCPNDGVVLVGDDESWYFPAFVLEIVSRPEEIE